MRLFKRRPVEESAENIAAMARLDAVVGRVQVELPIYSTIESHLKPEGVQRRFWTPEELAAEGGRE